MNTYHPNTTVTAVNDAVTIIDRSRIVALMEAWAAEDGRPLVTGLRTVLEGWLASALMGTHLTEDRVARTLRTELGVREAQPKDVRAATGHVLAVLTTAARRFEFTNALLRAQSDLVLGNGADISIALGRIPVSASSHLTTASIVSNTPARFDSVPHVVVSVVPSEGAPADQILRSLLKSGRRVDHVVTSAGILPSPLAPSTSELLSELKLVTDYVPAQEGTVQATADEAILVEGRWYSANLTEAARTAMREHRASSKANRNANDCVIDPALQQTLDERRDALVDTRRRYETTAPDVPAVTQHYPYGSTRWTQSFLNGERVNEKLQDVFTRVSSRLIVGPPSLTTAADHLHTTLALLTTNAHRIAEWKDHHVLNEGHGILADEWYVLYHLVVARIQDAMTAWSLEHQPDAVAAATSEYGWGAYWHIDHDEDAYDWRPDGGSTVVEVQEADEATAANIADRLVARLQDQADLYSEGAPEYDLSHDARIELRFEFIDTDNIDHNDNWLPFPPSGVLLAAEAELDFPF